MKKVVKFGGSSLASANQIMKAAKIIKSDETRRYVVPSAPGMASVTVPYWSTFTCTTTMPSVWLL